VSTLLHSTMWGQSLAAGSQGSPSLSTVTEASNAFLVASAGTYAIALKNSSTQLPMLTWGYRIAQHTPAQTFGFSNHAVSGNTIAQLSKGGSSGKYEEMLNYISAAKTQVTNGGGTYEFGSFHQIQGEADQTFGTTAADYINSFILLKNNFQTDAGAVTGSLTAIPIFLSQTASWAYYGNAARIGLAQLQIARTISDSYVVGGQYQLEYAEGLHLTNVGYYHLGELHARAELSVLSGNGWAPFAPTNVVLSDTQIVVQYHVPTGSLQFDTTIVATQPDMGFSLSGTTATITGVSITAVNEITIAISKPITEQNAKVGYGIRYGTGPGLGNLCDSETATSVYDNKRLANWALHFEEALPVVVQPTYYWSVDEMNYYDGTNFIGIAP